VFQLDDGYEEHNMVLDDLHMDILEKHHRDNMQIMASMLARVSTVVTSVDNFLQGALGLYFLFKSLMGTHLVLLTLIYS
jgi:hypothetical protein